MAAAKKRSPLLVLGVTKVRLRHGRTELHLRLPKKLAHLLRSLHLRRRVSMPILVLSKVKVKGQRLRVTVAVEHVILGP